MLRVRVEDPEDVVQIFVAAKCHEGIAALARAPPTPEDARKAFFMQGLLGGEAPGRSKTGTPPTDCLHAPPLSKLL